ncbi:MAG: hypothetical protein KDA28_05700, partial [Phycisphaerales bacterium]|nr:hypothetical protein [Phycisphaerales bacterium]
ADEQRLVTFLAVAMDDDVDPSTWYRLRRRLGTYADLGPIVWFPYSGALFTAQFAHCWIDHRAIGADDPASFGIAHRAPTDFWENSRRLVRMHRLKAIENPMRLATPGPQRWGMTASDVEGGYGVAHLYPDPLPMPGARPGFDIHVESERWADAWGDGTVAPYAAGTSIMFEPHLALEALRHQMRLPSAPGVDPLWEDPDAGGEGFRDAFRLDEHGRCVWVASDRLAIDQGPLILGIENARTGLVWDLFHAHPVVRRGMERLRLSRDLDVLK